MDHLPFHKECYDAGKLAYGNGVETVEQAAAANPYSLYGEKDERAKAISWNRGWSSMSTRNQPYTIGDYIEKINFFLD